MRHSWIAALGLVLFGGGSFRAVADTVPAKSQSSAQKTAVLKPTPKGAAKKVKKPQAPAAQKPVSKPKPVAKAKKPRAAPVVRMKPPAHIPAVTEASSVWHGCMGGQDVSMVASRLGMDETRLQSVLTEENILPGEGGGCLPYAVATGGEGGVAPATFQRSDAKAAVLALRKTSDGVTITPAACECPQYSRRILTLAAHDTFDPSNEVLAQIPLNVRWQFNILMPEMTGKLVPEQAGDSGMDPYTVRVVLESYGDGGPEHLKSIELLEAATGKRANAVWWLERPDGPGVFIGMDGLAYERLLWENPIKYTYQSRGVGPALTTFFRRVAAPKGSGSKATVVRAYSVRGVHLGVDMIAPKGVEVHAVGNASVAFAGRLGGFGNLIILDHGRGYQTYYAHLSLINTGIKPGAQVAGGEIIGLVGSTGHSTAPHLHFETRKDSVYLDPFDETRQLDFWLLTADDQERLAMELLASRPESANDSGMAPKQEHSVSDESR